MHICAHVGYSIKKEPSVFIKAKSESYFTIFGIQIDFIMLSVYYFLYYYGILRTFYGDFYSTKKMSPCCKVHKKNC